MQNLKILKHNKNTTFDINSKSIPQNSNRLANIELLRIISMIMVVTLHFLLHGGVLDRVNPFSANYYFAWTIEAICFVAVNCYVLISGYFLINSKFRLKKVIVMFLKIFIYSVLISVIFSLTGIIKLDIKHIFSSLGSTVFSYWFVNKYIALYFICPFLNIAIKAMTKKQLQYCIGILLFLFCIIPNVRFPINTFGVDNGYSLYWFVCLYIIAAFTKLYYTPSHKPVIFGLGFLMCSLLVSGSRFMLDFFNLSAIAGVFFTYNSILMISSSILLFLFFINLRITNGVFAKIILWLAPLSFAVYLIHENPNMRDFLWKTLFKPFNYVNSPFLVLYLITTVLIIYFVSSIIEFVLKPLFCKIENSKVIDIICSKITFDNIYGKIIKRIIRK